MDLVSKRIIYGGSQAWSPLRSPSNSIYGESSSSSGSRHSDTSFPVIAIAIVGIFATASLLVSYYIFVIKCCLNWHRIDLLRRLSFSRNRTHEDLLITQSLAMETRGLDESVIRSIPIFQFKINDKSRDFGESGFCECAVCLNEFQEDENLRMIPNCGHIFHIDCIDVWLQSNANCPLCRTRISSNTRYPIHKRIIAPSSTPRDPNPCTENVITSDGDFVVIELSGNHHSAADQTLLATQERPNSGDLLGRPVSPLPLKLERRIVHKKGRKLHKVTSMGDECIDIRGNKDEQFAIEPVRRSFSMDLLADPKLFSAIREAVRQERQVIEASPIEGCSRSKRFFFTFGHGCRGSRSAVLPVFLEP